MTSSHILVSRQQRVARGLRSAVGAGVDVIGPGAQFLGVQPSQGERIDDPDRVGPGGVSLVDRWVDPRGASAFGDPSTSDICADEIEIPPAASGTWEHITEVGPPMFLESAGVACSTLALAGSLDMLTQHEADSAVEQVWHRIASILWSPMSGVAANSHQLIGSPVDVSNGGVAPANARTASMALGRLEAALTTQEPLAYSRGLIHVPYALLPELVAKGLVITSPGSSRLMTANGNTVVADPAYQLVDPTAAGVDPAYAAAVPTVDDAVMYATPPITIWVGRPYPARARLEIGTNTLRTGMVVPVLWGWPGGKAYLHGVGECFIGPCDTDSAGDGDEVG